MGRRLTDAAHAAVADVLGTGDLAIDATVGNGQDTLFLARTVAPDGHVWGFDVQAAALALARRRLEAAGLAGAATLIEAGHETVEAHVTPRDVQGIAAAMFNLGYLPGGDHAVTTQPATSCGALRAIAGMLRAGGIITVMAYRGHAGGREEAEAVGKACEKLAVEGFAVTREAAPNDGPVLWVVRAPAA